MKKLILIFLLFFSNQSFSQNTRIEKSKIIPRDIDFKDCVKKITINHNTFNKKNDKIDSVKTISEINFSVKGNIQSIKSYNNSLTNLWSIVEFDHLGRIDKISRIDNNKMINYVNQYYSNKTEFPDSTLINPSENYKERYINHFKNDLVIKQDHYVNNSLQDYRVYKYNDQNQLIEDLYLNPENVSGETVVFKGSQMSVYPESLALYEYEKIKDTIITTKIRPKSSLKEVTKKLKTDKYSLEIIEEYDKNCLENSKFIYTYNDSVSYISYYYSKYDKEIRGYFKSTTTPKNITYKRKSETFYDKAEITEVTNIDIVYDKFDNWIKKIFTKKNEVTLMIEREIEYYCH